MCTNPDIEHSQYLQEKNKKTWPFFLSHLTKHIDEGNRTLERVRCRYIFRTGHLGAPLPSLPWLLAADLTPNPQVEAQVYLSDYVSRTWWLMAGQQWQSWTVMPLHSILDLLGTCWTKSPLPRDAIAKLRSILRHRPFWVFLANDARHMQNLLSRDPHVLVKLRQSSNHHGRIGRIW